jgi:hypothetical protein
LSGQRVGHVAIGDRLGQALDDRRLAHAGLADEHRVVLGAAAEHLHHPLGLLRATDDRVELVFLGQLGEVAPELVEHGRAGRAAFSAGSAGAGGGLLAAAAGALRALSSPTAAG